jgi:protein-tyrosine phosphatase
MSPALRVTAVCSGNICRSPIAEVVLRDALAGAGLEHAVLVDSAGIGGWHVGDPADRRSLAVLAAHGYDGSAHRVQQITRRWFTDDAVPAPPDLLLAMDATHHADLLALSPGAEVRLIREFDPSCAGLAPGDEQLDVPDPYYGTLADFEAVLAMIEAAGPGVIAHLRSRI